MRNAKKRAAGTRAAHADGTPAPGVPGENSDGGYNAGMAVFSYIIGGIIVWSLIGWGLDYLWGTRWIVLAGALLGAVGGFYLSHKHGLTSSRTMTGERPSSSGPSKDGTTNAK